MRIHLKLIIITILLTVPNMGGAQFKFPSPSPEGSIIQVVGNTKIKVQYERPSARGREIFGDLVPWNEVWRTGAGKCTKVTFDKDVIVGNQPIEAGSYSLFTIPQEKEWTVIFNSDTTLNGSGKYTSAKDIARFAVKPKKTSRFYEALTIDIDIVPNNAKMYISWTDIQIVFDIQTTTDEETLNYIDEKLMTGKEKDKDQYGMGAWFLVMKNTKYNDALALTQKMMEVEENVGWGRNLRREIYEEMHMYDEALQEIQKSIELTKKRNYPKDQEKWRARDIKLWEDMAERIRAKQKNKD